MKTLNNIQKALIKLTILFIFLFALTQVTAQTSNTVNIASIEWQKDSTSFNNIFKISDQHNTKVINLAGYSHAFKVAKQYNNIVYITITNSSYKSAYNTKQYIKRLNKGVKIVYITKQQTI